MSETKTYFHIARASEEGLEPMTGLRDWLKIRDLRLSEATDGEYDAWITRAVE